MARPSFASAVVGERGSLSVALCMLAAIVASCGQTSRDSARERPDTAGDSATGGDSTGAVAASSGGPVQAGGTGSAGAPRAAAGATQGGALSSGGAEPQGGDGGAAGVPLEHELALPNFDSPLYPTQGQQNFAQGVAVGDLNADRKLDIVLALDSGKVEVLLNQGGGHFADPVFYDVPGEPRSVAAVAIADLNGDDRLDVALSNYEGTDGTSVFLNDGTGVLQPFKGFEPGHSLGGYVGSILAVDLNEDGKLDLALGGGPVLFNDGGAVFSSAADCASGNSNAVASADLDGDGLPDLIFSTNTGIQVNLNQGGGQFAPPARYDLQTGAYAIAVADLNRDTRPDVLATNLSWSAQKGSAIDRASVLLNRGDGRLSEPLGMAAGPAPWGAALGDLNGDQNPDLVIANFDTSTRFSVALNDGRAHFTAAAPFAEAASDGGSWRAVVLADLDNDGKQDIVLAGHSSKPVAFLLNTTP